jgi:hypothetical protein
MADRVGQHMGNYHLVSGYPIKSVNQYYNKQWRLCFEWSESEKRPLNIKLGDVSQAISQLNTLTHLPQSCAISLSVLYFHCLTHSYHADLFSGCDDLKHGHGWPDNSI